MASLSTPWGNTSDSTGGYHLVWTRDAVEAGLALLAIGNLGASRRMLAYLIATQQETGGWGQNYFPDDMAREEFYHPVERGFEREILKRLEYWKKLRDKRR